MSLLEYSTSYVPQYLDLVQITKDHEKIHWHEDEVSLYTDMQQWKTGAITEAEKSLVKNILRLFTTSDVAVGRGYYEKIIPVIKNNEARNMLGSFAAREGIHQRGYALLSDTLGFGEDFYYEFLEYQEMAEKFEFMTENIEDSLYGFATYLAKQTLIEGVSLYASFCMLLNFDRLGKFPGMCDVVRWSVADEAIHVEGNAKLFRIFLDENPELVDDVFKKDIYETARKLVDLEDAFVDRAFAFGEVDKLTKEEVKQYIRYIADYRLTQLGLKPNWGIEKDPLPWFNASIKGGHTSFFERNVTSYLKANLEGSFDEGYGG